MGRQTKAEPPESILQACTPKVGSLFGRGPARSIQRLRTAPQRSSESIVNGAGKMAGDAIYESVLQAAGAPVIFAQFDGHVDQYTFYENALTRGPHMPDSFVGIALATQIIGLAAVAWFDRPEIDPGDNGWIIVPAGEGTKGRKIIKVFDDEHVGGYSGHGLTTSGRDVCLRRVSGQY
jgi:hypothetical protein